MSVSEVHLATQLITAELDRNLAGVNITFQVNGNSHFWRPVPKPIAAIEINSGIKITLGREPINLIGHW